MTLGSLAIVLLLIGHIYGLTQEEEFQKSIEKLTSLQNKKIEAEEWISAVQHILHESNEQKRIASTNQQLEDRIIQSQPKPPNLRALEQLTVEPEKLLQKTDLGRQENTRFLKRNLQSEGSTENSSSESNCAAIQSCEQCESYSSQVQSQRPTFDLPGETVEYKICTKCSEQTYLYRNTRVPQSNLEVSLSESEHIACVSKNSSILENRLTLSLINIDRFRDSIDLFKDWIASLFNDLQNVPQALNSSHVHVVNTYEGSVIVEFWVQLPSVSSESELQVIQNSFSESVQDSESISDLFSSADVISFEIENSLVDIGNTEDHSDNSEEQNSEQSVTNQNISHQSDRSKTVVLIVVGITSLITLLIVLCFVIFRERKKSDEKPETPENDSPANTSFEHNYQKQTNKPQQNPEAVPISASLWHRIMSPFKKEPSELKSTEHQSPSISPSVGAIGSHQKLQSPHESKVVSEFQLPDSGKQIKATSLQRM